MPNLTNNTSLYWDGTSATDWAGLTSDEWANKLTGTNCLPERVYGPIHHTLFLGCSVSSFSASVGWNEQQSELTVNLVQDACEGTKIYWDEDLQVQLWTAADPGFIGETIDIIGSPAYFRVDNFEYTGLIQSWDKTNSASGYPTYTVKLVDPRQIIEGAQLIIGEYAGGVSSVYNLFNVFGYMESLGQSCPETYLDPGSYPSYDIADLPEYSDYLNGSVLPDGAIFGSEAQGFGGANVNENGMQWTYILNGLNVLANSAIGLSNAWSPYGRLLLKATNSTFGMGLLSGDRFDTLGSFPSLPVPSSRWLAEYFLDLSELPTPPTYWRLNGSNTSIMDAISSLLADAGYDYYIELIPVRAVSSLLAPSGVAKFIKIRTVKRLSQPDLGQIDAFIDNSEGTVNTSVGREFRNEPTTSFLIGGKKNTYYQIEATDVEDDDDPVAGGDLNDDIIVPHFGLNADGTYIQPEIVEDDDGVKRFKFRIYIGGLDAKLRVVSFAGISDANETIEMTELELIAARSTLDSWMTYIWTMATDTGLALKAQEAAGMWNIDNVIQILDDIDDLQALRAMDFTNLNTKNTFLGVAHNAAGVAVQEDIQTLFNWVKTIATEYYGRKYQVAVPFTCVRQDGESSQILTSESPTQTGWTERPNIMGLQRGTAAHAFMTDENGKTECMMRFDTGTTEIDFSELNEDSYVTQIPGPVKAAALYVRCEVQDEYAYSTTSYTDPRAIVTIPAYIKDMTNALDHGMRVCRLLYQLIDLRLPAGANRNKAKNIVANALKNIGNKMAFALLDYPAMHPDAAGFGIQSNILTYGPWATAGPAGTVRVDHDSGLVPWEYGGISTLNLAGNTKANEGITYMQVGEKGSITVPGYPIIPLGAELGAYHGGFYGGGTNLVENRVASLTGGYYVTDIGGWTGLYGPNITDINVSVGDSGLNTTYNVRTYTPKFGRFSYHNADRLKAIGRNRLQTQREMARQMLRVGTRIAKKRFKNALAGAAKGADFNNGAALNANSPHEVLVGTSDTFRTDYKRTSISTSEINELGTDTNDRYDEKAFMSLDGLIRPVSMDGDGGLPPYASSIPSFCNQHNTASQQPPVEGYYDDVINIDYLNPFSNPAGKSRSTLQNRAKISADYVGHDMNILGRGTEIPVGEDGPTGLTMPFVGYNDPDKSDYDDDYRMFSMRGPILLQSWGYDLDGRPIPNRADSEVNAAAGSFTNTSLECYFLPQWLKKPDTWPVAPIDLRFDRARGVWVSPPSYRLMYGTTEEELCCDNTTGVMVKLDETYLGRNLYDCDGSTLGDKFITVKSPTKQCLPSGDPIVAYYDPYNCEYYLLEESPPKLWNLDCSGVCEDLEEVGCFHDLAAGTGLHIHKVLNCDEEGRCCTYAISNNIQICGSGGACNEDPTEEVCITGLQKIVLGSGLRVSREQDEVGDDRDCIINIDACNGLSIDDNDDCPPVGSDPGGSRYTNLTFTGGITAVEDGTDSSKVKVGLSFDVGGVPDVNEITLGDCLAAASDGSCAAKISFADAITPTDGAGRLWFVSDVDCSGSSLIVTKSYFDFSDCGTITGTGDEE